MSVDLQGPANAPNSVTVRPGDTRVFGSVDTFFKDCTTPGTGTKVQASFLNGVLAQIRSLIRGNGNTAVPAPVVTEDNSDDSMLVKAVQYLIQRGQPIYAVDTSVALGTVTVALSPACVEYKAGLTLNVLFANDCPGATVINVNVLGNKNVVRGDGSALQPKDFLGGMMGTVRYDGTKFQLLSLAPRALTSNTTFYVNGSTGSDSTLDGTAAAVSGAHGPFATIQKAFDVAANYAPGPFSITINVAAGTYGPAKQHVWTHPNIILIGAGSGSTIISGGLVAAVWAYGSGNIVTIKNLKTTATNSASGSASILADQGAQLIVDSGCIIDAGYAQTTARYFGTITLIANVTFSGTSTLGALCALTQGAVNTIQFIVITCSSLVTGAFAYASDAGASVGSSGVTFSGTPTAQRYSSNNLAEIQTLGSGATYFPGTTPGTTSNNGIYI